MKNTPEYTDKGFLKLKDGAIFDKYQSKNIVSQYLISGFKNTLLKFITKSAPTSIHEVGCGEGELSEMIATIIDIPIKASDYDENCIIHAKQNQKSHNILYQTNNIYELTPKNDSADLIICCEVLEHLESPLIALKKIKELNANYYIFSVPREPLWRILNMLRGKYWKDLGNTPTHIQHWSKRRFRKFISEEFNIIEFKNPTPWSMLICKRK